MGKEVHRRGGNRYVLLKTNPTSTEPLNAMQLQSLMDGSMRVTLFWRREESMTDYLPEVYQQFERRYPRAKEAFDALGAAEHEAGPLAERERRLIKLGIAVGAESEGGVRSHVRKLLGVGVSEEEVLHTIVLALTTIGFPATNAALSWAEEVLAEEI